MAIGSILLGVALLVVLALFIARPFFSPPEKEVALTEQQLLLNEKEALLDQIQLLDFDHDTGKLSTELHTFQRERLVEQATAVLQALDGLGGSPIPEADSPLDDGVDSEIEAAIARMRQPRSQTPAAATTSPPAPVPVNGKARFCPQCGTPTDSGDRFCVQCGHQLTLTTSTHIA